MSELDVCQNICPDEFVFECVIASPKCQKFPIHLSQKLQNPSKKIQKSVVTQLPLLFFIG